MHFEQLSSQDTVVAGEDLVPPLKKKRGRQSLDFHDLSDYTKGRYSKTLENAEPLDKLLRAAEKSAWRNSCPGVAKILDQLRTGGEQWACDTLESVSKIAQLTTPSIEKSLTLKIRLSLSKKQYTGFEKFARELGVKLLHSWASIMEYRNQIIPSIPPPNWDRNYLTVQVPLRDMIANIVTRLLELDNVRCNLIDFGESVDCILHVSAGVDSATGFSHYKQDRILRNDESLLSEHIMPLMFEAENKQLWVNPRPQSDVFCRAQSMSWVKETDVITQEKFCNFYSELNDIEKQPIVIDDPGTKLRVKVSAIYALIDGKAANAIVRNRDTHACPLCAEGADDRVGPSYFHSRLNTVEWLIRISAQKMIPGHPAQADPAVKKAARDIANKLEDTFKVSVNRPKIGGSGSSNDGNLARLLLRDQVRFAEGLGIKVQLVENIRLLSSLALSSVKLDSSKIKRLYDETERLIKEEFPFIKKLPPCVHKYGHLPDFIGRLVSFYYCMYYLRYSLNNMTFESITKKLLAAINFILVFLILFLMIYYY